MSKTLYDKIWEDHLVHEQSDGTSLIYVDRHLVHEVTSPQAFEGLRLQKRKVAIETQFLNVEIEADDIAKKSEELQKTIASLEQKEERWFELSMKLES